MRPSRTQYERDEVRGAIQFEVFVPFKEAISSKNLIPLIAAGRLTVTVMLDEDATSTVNPLGSKR